MCWCFWNDHKNVPEQDTSNEQVTERERGGRERNAINWETVRALRMSIVRFYNWLVIYLNLFIGASKCKPTAKILVDRNESFERKKMRRAYAIRLSEIARSTIEIMIMIFLSLSADVWVACCFSLSPLFSSLLPCTVNTSSRSRSRFAREKEKNRRKNAIRSRSVATNENQSPMIERERKEQRKSRSRKAKRRTRASGGINE